MKRQKKLGLWLMIWVGVLLVVLNTLYALAAEKPYAGTTIRHSTLLNPEGDSPRERALRKIINNFERKTGIKVVVETVPVKNIDSKVIAAVQAGTPPDLSRIDPGQIIQHIAADTLIPLNKYADVAYTEEEKKDFMFYDRLTEDGIKRTFYISVTLKALYMRKDLLIDAGLVSPTAIYEGGGFYYAPQIPKTWKEFVNIAQKLTTKNRAGYLFYSSTEQLNFTDKIFQPMIRGRGGRILDEEGNPVFNEEAGVQTFKFLRDLVHKYQVTPKDVVAVSYNNASDAFDAGVAAMWNDSSHRYMRHAKAVGGRDKILLAKDPVPEGMPYPSPTVITGWTLGIPRGASHPDAAWEFIKYFNSNEAQSINASIAGEIPTRLSTLKDPYFNTREAAHIKWWLEYAAEKSVAMVHPLKRTELNIVMGEALQKLILDPNFSVEKVLDEAVERYKKM